ncbi:hypothetical protein PSEUDO8AS_40178 [Pseudomonas sp. 8AS]|nr:hypothetical protein PSEUDO8AS_40178 [Pseudomonas sp. 8AS]
MERGTEAQRRIGQLDAFGGDVLAIGALQADRLARALGALLGQHRGEIQIARLVVRRVGVGDIAGQHFGTLSAKAEGLFVDAECVVEADAHDLEPLPLGDLVVPCQIYSKGYANFIYRYFSMTY